MDRFNVRDEEIPGSIQFKFRLIRPWTRNKTGLLCYKFIYITIPLTFVLIRKVSSFDADRLPFMTDDTWNSISAWTRNIRIRSEIFFDINFFVKFSGKTETVCSNPWASLVEYSSYFYTSRPWSQFYGEQYKSKYISTLLSWAHSCPPAITDRGRSF